MFVITGGGTGGHLAIAQALGEELRARGIKAIYIGSLYGQDRKWFNQTASSDDCYTIDSSPAISHHLNAISIQSNTQDLHNLTQARNLKHSLQATPTQITQPPSQNEPAEQHSLFQACYFLNTMGVVNKSGVKKLIALYAQVRALYHIRKIFARHGVCAVISVGGFSAGPASLGAILLKKPLFIHEQNAIQGRLNTLLAPFAKRIFSAFSNSPTPYPIKQEALQQQRIRTSCKNIIFIGGSQGARAINTLALHLAPMLLQQGYTITHQCGEKEFSRVAQAYKHLELESSAPPLESSTTLLESSAPHPLAHTSTQQDIVLNSLSMPQQSSNNPQQEIMLQGRVLVFAFDRQIITHLSKADICIARAGASSIWENAALALPTIYIPYPYAANNHQYHNALYFTQKNLGVMLCEQELYSALESTPDIKAFFRAFNHIKEHLSTISHALSKEISTNGAQNIITEIKDYMDSRA